MDNNSDVWILLIVLIVSAFLLIVLRLAQFVNHFRREKQYLLTEISRAEDYNEYRYWRRELRCLYLCLIPFVTERNVMKVYPVFFHRTKHSTKEKRTDGLMYILAPSVVGICICAVCLCGASWAWFTASTSTGTTAVQSSSYRLSYRVDEDAAATELAEAKTVTVPVSGRCTITLSATGTAGATGYCRINIGDETYYTGQIFVPDAFTFTVKAAANTQITLTPKWGSCAVRDNTNSITKDRVIPATGSQQSNTQTPDNSVTAEPSAEPAPTTPTTPSSTPTESTTTTSKPSATDPAATQSEPPGTEQTPPPETATPGNTTAAQTEPPTTEESENN